MKKLIAITLSATLLAGAAFAEPVTRTSTFDGPKASGTKTTTTDSSARISRSRSSIRCETNGCSVPASSSSLLSPPLLTGCPRRAA